MKLITFSYNRIKTNIYEDGGSLYELAVYIIIMIIIIVKKGWHKRLRESDIHPISQKTLPPQYQPIDRKKRREK